MAYWEATHVPLKPAQTFNNGAQLMSFDKLKNYSFFTGSNQVTSLSDLKTVACLVQINTGQNRCFLPVITQTFFSIFGTRFSQFSHLQRIFKLILREIK